jgi:hypothetical protein
LESQVLLSLGIRATEVKKLGMLLLVILQVLVQVWVTEVLVSFLDSKHDLTVFVAEFYALLTEAIFLKKFFDGLFCFFLNINKKFIRALKVGDPK